jgi:hemolysin D
MLIGGMSTAVAARAKVFTFPFTKCHLVDAHTASVSDDATVDEKLGLIYRAQIKLAANEIVTPTKALKLMPGMAVTAEVKTGNRRIIEFFLAPLLQHQQEALRER